MFWDQKLVPKERGTRTTQASTCKGGTASGHIPIASVQGNLGRPENGAGDVREDAGSLNILMPVGLSLGEEPLEVVDELCQTVAAMQRDAGTANTLESSTGRADW